jgi:uncharacterized protein
MTDDRANTSGVLARPTTHRRDCPSDEAGAVDELVRRVSRERFLMDALGLVAASGLPDAWIGAGVVRDVVWGQLNGGFEAATVNDVDVVFFDPHDLSRDRDRDAGRRLAALADLPWEATNQAAVHTWYHEYFGGAPVAPFGSVHDGVATWPETATCVALRATAHGIEVCAPHGLGDLLDGVWRRNPTRVTVEQSNARLARHRITQRWPSITVVRPDG